MTALSAVVYLLIAGVILVAAIVAYGRGRRLRPVKPSLPTPGERLTLRDRIEAPWPDDEAAELIAAWRDETG